MAQPVPTPVPGLAGCPDDSFGPFAGYQCRGGFDFTLLFEEAILTIPLQSLLLLVLPFRIVKLLQSEAKVGWGFSRPLKLTATACLVGLSAALLALWTNTSAQAITRTRATIPTAALVFVASVAVFLLSWLEHERSLRPSFFLFCYLFLGVLLDLPRVRTVWMLGSDQLIPILMTCSLALRAVMLVLESIEKRSIIAARVKYSFEMTASTLSRATFLWLNPLFKLGYKKTLALDDLYPLDERLQAQNLYPTLAQAWGKVPNKEKPGALFNTYLAALGTSLLAPVFPRLCVMAFSYSQPFLIQQAIMLAQLPKAQFFDNWGYGLIGAFALVYGGLAIAQGQYMWRVRRTGAKTRASLFALIYGKSLRLDITSPNVSPMAALTLMGTDTEAIIQGINLVHEIWASFVEIGVATWLIYKELGPACAMPIALAVVTISAAFLMGVPIGKSQAAWILASQVRVTATSKTLGCVKSLRISGLNNMAFDMIRKLRVFEMAASMKFRLLLGASLILLILVPLWSPILTFATWAGVSRNNNDALSLGKVFGSYLFIVLLATPLTQLLIALPALLGSMACCQRIQDHMNGKERQDSRNKPVETAAVELPSDEPEKPATPTESNSSDDNASTAIAEKSAASIKDDCIASVKGRFCWAEGTDPVFNVPDWNIKRGTVTFVVGPVGSGKSTLLKALLGELSAFEGTLRTNYSGAAYCDQTPWIPNETVRRIITGHSVVDEAWYQAVIHACALNQDLAKWPNGDETAAGSQGISFSGGQKQRLAIARAIYSKREFLIFDDVLSGLDAGTENKVFNRVFGKEGLIRSSNMTIVAAASSTARLPYADLILALDEKGSVAHVGTPKKLRDILKLGDAELGWEAHAEDLDTAEVEAAEDIVEYAVEDTKEDPDRRLGDSAMYMFYARAAGRHMLVTLAISMAVYAFCQAFPTLWIGWWAGDPEPLENLGKWIGVYVALGVGAVLSVGLGIWQLLILIINRAGIKFHDAMIDVVSQASMSFHSTVDSGVIVNRFSQDLRLIDMDLPQSLFSVATTTAGGLAQFILVCVSAKYMVAFLPVLGVILYVVQFVYLRTSRQLRLLDIEQTAPLYTSLIETLGGLATIRAFQWEAELEQKNMQLINNSLRPYYLLASVQSWLNFITDIFVMIIALAFAVLATTLRDTIGAGLIGTGLTNILSFSNSMKAFVTYWVMLETALGAVSRVRSFTQATPLEGSGEDKPEEPPREKEWPSEGAIEIKNVNASYLISGPVLKDVSLSIGPGERVAICGRTGSGKSSLTLCILRMMDQVRGSIVIDGVDIKSLPHQYVRSRLVALPQDSYIFDGTARLNVDPTQASSDEEIIDVLKKVRLWSKLEARGKLDSIISDDFFSPGESQLLVFARAMLRKSKILILDEFTSSLDDESGAIVEELLRACFKGWTVVAIAHKLQSIVDFDKVGVLDAGRIVEFGVPRELLAQESSVFKDMYSSSSKN